jgi:hypothetical protein
MPLVPLRSWGMLTTRGSCPLKLFLCIVSSEDFASLTVLSISAGVASPGKSRKSDFVPWRRGR